MRPMRWCALLCLLAPLTAQASFVTFGDSCAWNNEKPLIGNFGLPRLGTTLTILYRGPNFTFSSGQQIAQPILLLSLGAVKTPLPTTFLPLQPPGCVGLVRPDVLLPMPMDSTKPQFVDQVPVPVPNDPNLIGLVVFAQWLTHVQQCGFAGCGDAALLTGNAAKITVGI
jgi:hypothetical protein